MSCNTLTTAGDLNIGGQIFAPNRVHFHASVGGARTMSINQCIVYDDIKFQFGTGNNYNHYNGVYTVSVRGKYFFHAGFETRPNVPYNVALWYFS